MRVFAGPNGSGKSTVIQSVADYMVKGHPIDFGVYVNADDIARKLSCDQLVLGDFGLERFDLETLFDTASQSGLFSYVINKEVLQDSILFHRNGIRLVRNDHIEPIAQIIANGIRASLLKERKKFSFETVFSHASKVEFMRECSEIGYKVYLYFVGTSNPEINKFRVQFRVSQGGHSVPEDKIVDRYYRSMELLWEATRCCYQAFFFDNSRDGIQPTLFASYKVVDGAKDWDRVDDDHIPSWFAKYYLSKANAAM
jgi:predicted ABC-type ATPase